MRNKEKSLPTGRQVWNHFLKILPAVGRCVIRERKIVFQSSPDEELTMNQTVMDEKYMKLAINEAQRAARDGEVPVGAVLVKGSRVLAEDHNRCIGRSDPTAHAEVLVLRKAGKALGNYRLKDTIMYVTVEPCPMCLSAMIHARVARLVYGTLEPKFGAVESKFKLLREKGLNHRVEVSGGILEEECSGIIGSFFKQRRASKKTGFEIGFGRMIPDRKKVTPNSELKTPNCD